MSLKLIASAVVAAALLIAPVAAQTPPVTPAPIPADVQRTLDRLREAALESDRGYDIVEGLVTDIGPRLAGSDAEARARDWSAAMLRSLRLDNVRIETTTTPFWDATLERASIIAPTQQAVATAALGGSPSTPPGGVEAEIVRFASLAALDAAPESAVRGRIVFIDEVMVRSQTGVGYGVAVQKRGQCAPRAQAKGAVACLIRAVGTNVSRFTHQGGRARQPEGTSLPAAAISQPDADILARLLARGPVRVRLEIESVMRDNAPTGNVIAEVRGREKPEEIVLLAAHLDSWDMGHGAVDDGFGVAVVSAAAALIRELPRRPRRTIRVLLAGAEENSGAGADDYFARHNSETHIVAAESDVGAGAIWRLSTKFGAGRENYAASLAAALAPLGIVPGANDANGGADIAKLMAAGMPGVDLDQDASLYFDVHHTPDDTLDKIDPALMRQNVAAYAVFAYLAAEMDWDFRAASAN